MTIETLDAAQRERLARRSSVMMSDFEEVALPVLPQVPGMISPGESRYLYWLAGACHTGAGAVVEVGTWLGRSTLHLAGGLRDSGYATPLHCFDNFVWHGASDNSKSGLNLPAGADFEAYFLENIAPFRADIRVSKTDFAGIAWPADQPIDILFLDGPKNAEHVSQCLRAFAPALVPGQTMLVFQDYQHPLSYDIPLAVQSLGDALALRHTVASGGTVSFVLERPLRADEISPEALDWQGKPLDEIRRLWAAMLAPLEGPVLQRMKAAYALHLCRIGETTAACDTLRGVVFDKRLHDGFTNWAAAASLRKTYQPLFDVYAAELAADR
jgi:hypothetical protein